MSLDHAAIDKIVNAGGNYGKGVTPNPFAAEEQEWERRQRFAPLLERLQQKIVSLYEPRYITPPATAEAIAAIVTLTDVRSILELGTHVGFTTYHMLRAVMGKPGARIVTVDSGPHHDEQFFSEFSSILTQVKGETPQILNSIEGPFQLVFVDSDHSLEHTVKEMDALMRLTVPGSIFLFHDLPEWQYPDKPTPHPAREFLLRDSRIRGVCLPSGEQADFRLMWGADYPRQCNPGLGIFVRL